MMPMDPFQLGILYDSLDTIIPMGPSQKSQNILSYLCYSRFHKINYKQNITKKCMKFRIQAFAILAFV